MNKLILFDVDGILIPVMSIKYDYWKHIVKEHFNLDVSKKDVYMQGKTDKQILKELLEAKGLKNPLSDKRFEIAMDDIGPTVAKHIESPIPTIENVEVFIKTLLERQWIIGLLTGNTKEKARVKLENCHLWKYFKIGAFGDASDKRSDLVQIAMTDAYNKTEKKFEKQNTYIIGDTIRDIKCARDAGVKSIAVATGKEEMNILKKENPDFIFKDFNNVEKIMEVLK